MQHQLEYATGDLLRKFSITTGILCLIMVIIMHMAMRCAAVKTKHYSADKTH